MQQIRLRRFAILSVTFALVIFALSTGLALSRLHISRGYWPFSQIQWASIEFNGEPPKIIGHRGAVKAEAGIPGNTFESIEEGINDKVDCIEIDLRTSSGKLFVVHDSISDLGLDSLKREGIRTLDEVFEKFNPQVANWIFDVKDTQSSLMFKQWLNRKMDDGELSNNQVIVFGRDDVLNEFEGLGFTLGYVFNFANSSNLSRVLFNQSAFFKRPLELGCNYLVLPIGFASESIINKAISSKLDVWAYGVNNRDDYNILARRGVTGFIVDDKNSLQEPPRIGSPGLGILKSLLILVLAMFFLILTGVKTRTGKSKTRPREDRQ